MGKQHWDNADDATPNQDWNASQKEGEWQLAENDKEENDERFASDEDADDRFYASGGDDDDDENEDDEDVNEDDDADDDEPADWGHTDPAEGHSPFPDPMDPSGPGSAV